jgi:S-adenosylmethionine hydrolase
LTAHAYFPEGTIYVVVVDPGVGSDRRALAARVGGKAFLGPDNGVLIPAIDRVGGPKQLVAIDPARISPGEISATFHGRDIFAPAAGLLAGGADISAFGEAIDDPVQLVIPEPRMTDGAIECDVIHVDRFGNAITSLHRQFFDTRKWHGARVEAGKVAIGPIARTYADVSPGEALALFGSAGYLEIAVRNDNAAQKLGLTRGSRVTLHRT